MSGIGQYLQETRAELRHVAWPTRTQTIVYTIMVALLSVGVALYLGLFDFIFTTTMTRVLNAIPAASPLQIQQAPTTPSTGSGQAAPLTPIQDTNGLKFVPNDTNTNIKVNTVPAPTTGSAPATPKK